MKVLLDTHILIWYVEGDEQLPPAIRTCLDNPETEAWVSFVSLWELTIKKSLGKLTMSLSLAELQTFFLNHSFNLLQLTFFHLETLSSLPYHHGDPFDRLLIAQAISEELVCITSDDTFGLYSGLKLL